jgi:hypothetical protein
MGQKLTGAEVKNLEAIIARGLIRAGKLERKIHIATSELAHEWAVNAWENQQELIAEARKLVNEYYEGGLN